MRIKLLIAVMLISGCSGSSRYPNWESVRIESKIPDSGCIYKSQDACGKAGAGCFNFFKKRATTFGANTVVITDSSKDQASYSLLLGVGGGSSITALADYYACPK